VAAALERWLDEAGVEVRLNTRVKGLVVVGARLTGVDLYHGRMDAAAAIVATGGLSYPGTGSTGDGHALAASVGHTIVPTRPALAPMLLEEAWVADLTGLALRNVEARLVRSDTGACLASELGEMLFTQTGVSGPIILTLSRSLRDVEAPTILSLDLKPALSRDDLLAKFVREFARAGRYGPYLRKLLPRSLAEVFPALTGVAHDRQLSGITSVERRRLIGTLKGLRLTVRGLAPIEEAVVTGGGVSLREVDPRTIMSTLVEGLFFAGEVLDLDAVTGGYNLQAAFSTGAAAGRSAACLALGSRPGRPRS
jgi:predicted Rossmann fold flavoprotein